MWMSVKRWLEEKKNNSDTITELSSIALKWYYEQRKQIWFWETIIHTLDSLTDSLT